ncbi:MAG: ABC transporter permease, partial [Candidatus Methanofastidiosia archaeon]
MRPDDYVRVVLRNLNRIRVRTALTTVGVIIGVAAIVVLLSIGFGFEKSVTEQLEGIGDIKEITVYRSVSGFGMGMRGREEIKMLDDSVVEEILKLEGVQAVVPSVSVSGTIEVVRYITSTTITGIDPRRGEALNIEMEKGRFLRENDRDAMVVGYKIAETFVEKKTLKKVEDLALLGKKAEIIVKRRNLEGEEETKSFRMRIVGVVEEQGTQSDYKVYIPMDTAVDLKEWQSFQSNILKRQGYETLIVKAEDANTVTDITQEITNMGFLALSFKQIIEGLSQVFTLVQILLLGIGAIALVVAALGIINTMLMSILERTREIGIMKAIGASNTDVTKIFLMESLTIGFLGGVGGAVLGYVAAHLIDALARIYVSQQGGVAESIVSMPAWLLVFAIGFAMTVGLISGVYPARKAARLSPVDALR